MPNINDITKKLWDKEPTEIVASLKSQKVVTSWNWQEQAELIKQNMFTVAKVFSADVVQDIHDALVKSLAKGDNFDNFKKDLKPLLEKKGYLKKDDGSAFRLDTIYRTNMQNQYMSGRKKQQDFIKSDFPIRQYIAINDKRTTKICTELDDKVFYVNDTLANTFYPPNHFNCRSRVRSFTEGQAKRRGLKPKKLNPNDLKDIGKGFEHPPSTKFIPDLNKYNPKLKKKVKKDVDNSIKKINKMENEISNPITLKQQIAEMPKTQDKNNNLLDNLMLNYDKELGKDYSKKLRKQSDFTDYHNSLDKDTYNALIKNYFGSGESFEINKALRKKSKNKKALKLGEQIIKGDVDYEIDNVPKLFRGESYEKVSSMKRFLNLKVGDNFDNGGSLTSTSTDYETAEYFAKSYKHSVFMEIETPDKFKAGLGEKFEYEYILHPDSKFTVQEIKIEKSAKNEVAVFLKVKLNE